MTSQQSIQQRPTSPVSDYRDLCIEEAVARIADLEHDYALTRLMLSETLTIAEQARRAAARERKQRLAVVAEYRQFRVMTMARSLANSASETQTREKPQRRPTAHFLLDSDRPTERPNA